MAPKQHAHVTQQPQRGVKTALRFFVPIDGGSTGRFDPEQSAEEVLLISAARAALPECAA